MSKIVSFVLKMMASAGKKYSSSLDLITKNPKEEQEKLLKTILSYSLNSELGKEYDFKSIKTIEDFQRQFPLTDYDFYSEKIERMMKGEQNVLTSLDVIHYNVTSGTLGNPKKIPVTEKHVKIFSNVNAKYLNYLVKNELGTEWMKYKGLSLAEGSYQVLPTGVTVGCASSLHSARMGKVMPFMKQHDSSEMMYTSPKEARQPSSLGSYTRYLHALFALKERDISYGNVTFSSYLLEVMRYIELHYASLCDDIESGRVGEQVEIPDDVRESINHKLTPDINRANELRTIFKNGFDQPFVPLVWPRLKFFICVGGANFQSYTDKLKKKYLGEKIDILYMGLSASEAMISVPLSLNNIDSVFLPDTTFYEFIPMNQGEADLQNIKLLDELEVGKQYELVISNVSGLFRYRMKDVIEITGFKNKTPLMRFVSRSGYAINMYAEKTSEQALLYAATKTAEKYDLDLVDYIVCPKEEIQGSNYIYLYEFNKNVNLPSLEELAKVTETYLEEANPVYKESIDDGSLGKLKVKVLQEQTFMLYKDLLVLKGASNAQLKPIHVTQTPFQQRFFFGLVDDNIK